MEKGFKKSIEVTLIFSFLIFFATILIAPLLIRIIYGQEYSAAASILRILSILILIAPITAIFHSYYYAKNKPLIIAKFLIITTVLNIVLNYFLISFFLEKSNYLASVGAALATIISKALNLFFLFIFWSKRFINCKI